MNPQLEKLIDLALADGILTEQKKQVLYKKAKELNEDMDEFEMVLNAQVHLKQQELNKSNVNIVFPVPPMENKSNKQDAIDNLGKLNISYNQGNLIIYIQKRDLEVVKILLRAGLNPNDIYTEKQEKKDVSFLALNSAIDKGYNDVVNLLIEYGADVNYFDSIFSKPLNIAIEKNNIELVKLLIENGADVNKGNDTASNIPIIQSIKLKQFATVQIIANKADLNIVCSPSWSKVTPLIYAIEEGQIDSAKIILENGADINKSANSNLETPLITAIKNKNIEAVKLLIEKGADVNKARKDGDTPMLLAHQRKYDVIIELLISAGASPLTEIELRNSATAKAKIFSNIAAAKDYTKRTLWPKLAIAVVVIFLIFKGCAGIFDCDCTNHYQNSAYMSGYKSGQKSSNGIEGWSDTDLWVAIENADGNHSGLVKETSSYEEGYKDGKNGKKCKCEGVTASHW